MNEKWTKVVVTKHDDDITIHFEFFFGEVIKITFRGSWKPSSKFRLNE